MRSYGSRSKARPARSKFQARLSAFSLDPSKVEAFGEKWERRLQEIFQN